MTENDLVRAPVRKVAGTARHAGDTAVTRRQGAAHRMPLICARRIARVASLEVAHYIELMTQKNMGGIKARN
jgi:hypothetical protein